MELKKFKFIDMPSEKEELKKLQGNYSRLKKEKLYYKIYYSVKDDIDKYFARYMHTEKNKSSIALFFKKPENEIYKQKSYKVYIELMVDFITTHILNNIKYFLQYANKNINAVIYQIYKMDLILNKYEEDVQLLVSIEEDGYYPVSILKSEELSNKNIMYNIFKGFDSDINLFGETDIKLKIKNIRIDNQNISFTTIDFFNTILSSIYDNRITIDSAFEKIIESKITKSDKQYINLMSSISNLVKQGIKNKADIPRDEGLIKKYITNVDKIITKKIILKDIKEDIKNLYKLKEYIENSSQYVFKDVFYKFMAKSYYFYNYYIGETELMSYVEFLENYHLFKLTNIQEVEKIYQMELVLKTIRYKDSAQQLKKINRNLKYTSEDYKIIKSIQSTDITRKSKVVLTNIVEQCKLFNHSINTKKDSKDYNNVSGGLNSMFFYNTFKELKRIGINEKQIRIFLLKITKYILKKEKLKIINIENKIPDESFVHDVLFTIIGDDFKFIMNQRNIKNISNKFNVFINKFISVFVSINYSTSAMDTFINNAVSLSEILTKITLDRLVKIKNANDFQSIILEEEREKVEKLKLKISKHIAVTDKDIKISNQMGQTITMFNLLERVISNKELLEEYNSTVKYTPIIHRKDKYTLEVQTHQHIPSLLARGLKSVCIDINSTAVLDQLNKNHFNILVTNKKGVPILWGMLLKLNMTNNIYILNNLQGNMKVKEDTIKIELLNIMKEFKKQLNIEKIYLKQLFFNNIDLTSELELESIEDDMFLYKDEYVDMNVSNKQILETKLFVI